MLKCSTCKTNSDAFKCVDELEAHIASEHFDCMPFECEKCRFSKFPTEFAIKRHFEEDHRMLEYYVNNNKQILSINFFYIFRLDTKFPVNYQKN